MDLTCRGALQVPKEAVEANDKGLSLEQKKELPAYVSMVDPFLVEALQNPRHRLTILRMELDIQKFLQNSGLHQFEFPHFPTSYLRLAAHRVAQHYGLQTVVQDNAVDGQGNRILVLKKPESRLPAVRLSEIPAGQSENEKPDGIKIVLKSRPSKASANGANGLGLKGSPVRTVEERKDEYERARARIFSSPSSSESEDASFGVASDRKNLTMGENEALRNFVLYGDRGLGSREIVASSRVAIFRDREKDRTDPDYDRSYERYVKNLPSSQSFNVAPINVPKFPPTFVQYDSVVPQLGQMPVAQASFNYRSPVMTPYHTMGLNQTSRDALYMQWPTQSMMYAQSYDHLRRTIFQAPFCQQPLSFEYTQNHL